MKLRLLLLSLLSVSTALACINTTETHLEADTQGEALLKRVATPPKEAYQHRLQLPATTPSRRLEVEALNFIAAGNYQAALPLLQKAEATAPGSYSIAANLGTTYELTGNNTEALRWIKEAIRRNPKSHQGTEWVHVLILEAKVRNATQPAAAPLVSLLVLPEILTADTLIHAGQTTRPAKDVRFAIGYQLNERLVFVKPTDPYVADLLFTLAFLDAHLARVQPADHLTKRVVLVKPTNSPAADPGVNQAMLAANLAKIKSAQTLLTLAERYGYSDPIRIGSLRAVIDQELARLAPQPAVKQSSGYQASR